MKTHARFLIGAIAVSLVLGAFVPARGAETAQAAKRVPTVEDLLALKSVGGVRISPDGAKIAFSAAADPDLVNGATSDIYVLDLAGDAVKKIVDQPGPDSSLVWSPDGRSILFSTVMGRSPYFFLNSRLAVVPAEGGAVRSLTDAFDENPSGAAWNGGGIWFSASQKTASHLFRLDPETRRHAAGGRTDSRRTPGARRFLLSSSSRMG